MEREAQLFYLPDEIWVFIFRYLQRTPSEVVQKGLVCKLWNNLTLLAFTEIKVNKTTLPPLFDAQKKLCRLDAHLLKMVNLNRLRITRLTPELMTCLSKLEYLDFSLSRSKSIFVDVLQTKLKELLLVDNQITEIPEGIKSATNLTTLNLTNNQLAQLPQSFSCLTNLTQLRLSRNFFQVFPKEIVHLTNLKELLLTANKIPAFPNQVTLLTNLQELYLGENNFTEFPAELQYLPNLVELNMARNHITKVPKFLQLFVHLKVLNLSGNQIVKIPKCLQCLEQLRADVTGNHNIIIPDVVSNIFYTRNR